MPITEGGYDLHALAESLQLRDRRARCRDAVAGRVAEAGRRALRRGPDGRCRGQVGASPFWTLVRASLDADRRTLGRT